MVAKVDISTGLRRFLKRMRSATSPGFSPRTEPTLGALSPGFSETATRSGPGGT